MKTTVGDVMTSPAISISPEATFKETVARLTEHRIDTMPVLDGDGAIVGVVSESDLVLKEAREPLEDRPKVMQGPRTRAARAKVGGRTVGELMTTPAVTVRRDGYLQAAAATMHQHGVHSLPVVDEHGHLVGMVSRTDLLKAFLVSDAKLREEVLHFLDDSLSLNTTDLKVAVADGVVTVAGVIEKRSQMPVVEEHLARLDGVVAVDATEVGYRTDDTADGDRRRLWAPRS